MSRCLRPENRAAFSLIELSIVLAIMGVIGASSLPFVLASQKTKDTELTLKRMDDIEAALVAFRLANKRIPCPSDVAAALITSTYGTEAATPGTCTGLSGDGSNAVYGGVPVKTLGLPDEWGFDAWGGRIVYHVDKRMTATNATDTYPAASTTPGVFTVYDGAATPAARTAKAVYVLVSGGMNGHGAYQFSGTARKPAGSTNTHEQANCKCNASAAATAYNLNFYQHMGTKNAADMMDNYDDLVRYRMRSGIDTLVASGGGGSAAAAGNTGEVQFNGGGNVFAADSNLFWDDTNNRLGVGTSSPANMLDVRGIAKFGANSNLALYDNTSDAIIQAPGKGVNFYDSTAGATRMYINTSGNVGIGTTSPGNSRLTVSASDTGALPAQATGVFDMSVNPSSGSHDVWGLQSYATATGNAANISRIIGVYGNAKHATSGTLAQTIGSTAWSVNASSGVLTDAIGATAGVWHTSGTTTNAYGFYNQHYHSGTGTFTNAYGLYLDAPSGPGTITNKWGVYQVDSTAKNYFAGNVGIGTTNPQEALQIGGVSSRFFTFADSGGGSGPYGTAMVSNGIIDQSVNPHTLKKTSTYSNGASAILMDHYGDIYMQGYDSGSSSVSSTAWSPQFTLDSATGNVGIGTVIPGAKLDISHSGIALRLQRSGYDTYDLRGSTGLGLEIYNATDSRSEMYFNGAGNVGIGTTNPGTYKLNVNGNIVTSGEYYDPGLGAVGSSYLCYAGTGQFGYCSSDRRLKRDVHSLRDGSLAIVAQLRPVSFAWMSDKRSDSGFIAQEVARLIPEATRKNKDGYFSLEINPLLAHVVKALQELKATNDSLADKLRDAEDAHVADRAAIDALERRLDKLEER